MLIWPIYYYYYSYLLLFDFGMYIIFVFCVWIGFGWEEITIIIILSFTSAIFRDPNYRTINVITRGLLPDLSFFNCNYFYLLADFIPFYFWLPPLRTHRPVCINNIIKNWKKTFHSSTDGYASSARRYFCLFNSPFLTTPSVLFYRDCQKIK